MTRRKEPEGFTTLVSVLERKKRRREKGKVRAEEKKEGCNSSMLVKLLGECLLIEDTRDVYIH